MSEGGAPQLPRLAFINKSEKVYLPRVPLKHRAKMQSFSFMELPAGMELRNRVYDHILDDMYKSTPPRSMLSKMKRWPIPIHPVLDYRGLTQACRVLRHEFRHLYISVKTFLVGAKSALSFLSTYYPELPNAKTMGTITGGRVIIELEDTAKELSLYQGQFWDFPEPPPPPFDMLPILQHCLIKHDIDIVFTAQDISSQMCPRARYARSLNRWICGHRAEWIDAVGRDLRHFYFEHNFRGAMELVFKKWSNQGWVVEVCSDLVVESEGQEEYLSALGMRHVGFEGAPFITMK